MSINHERVPFFPAMAVALGNLYHDEVEVEVEDVANVLACASVLGFKALQNT